MPTSFNKTVIFSLKNFPLPFDYRVSGKKNTSSLNMFFVSHPDRFSLFLTRLFIILALVYPFPQLSMLAQTVEALKVV